MPWELSRLRIALAQQQLPDSKWGADTHTSDNRTDQCTSSIQSIPNWADLPSRVVPPTSRAVPLTSRAVPPTVFFRILLKDAERPVQPRLRRIKLELFESKQNTLHECTRKWKAANFTALNCSTGCPGEGTGNCRARIYEAFAPQISHWQKQVSLEGHQQEQQHKLHSPSTTAVFGRRHTNWSSTDGNSHFLGHGRSMRQQQQTCNRCEKVAICTNMIPKL